MSKSREYSAGSTLSSSSRGRAFSPPRSPRLLRSIVAALVALDRPGVLSSSTFAMPCASSCVPSTLLGLTERIDGPIDCRAFGGRIRQSPRQRRSPRPLLGKRSLILDKHQRVRHLSPNCQGSERTGSWPNERPETEAGRPEGPPKENK